MTYTVLIVDDSKVSRMMLHAMINRERPQWQILEASSGQEAIELASRESIQLISMDLNMPGMDGIEAAEKIHDLHQETKIILLTANVQQSVRQRAANAQLHFSAKPINERTLSDLLTFAGA
ncbi:response regulator transcription factor [Chitinibacter sp. S2-10]|uniref:response regulator transcription factor n=1 Tax=Chitinibacter sp. S2-10 TaxID=3373597 RepID=UPI003977B1E9